MEYHGDEDLREEPSPRELELALDDIVECIMDHGQYPANGRVEFDLYDFLFDNRDPSYAMEMYVAAMSSDTRAMENRIERERKLVEAVLIKHLTGSELVADHAAAEYAE
tara:strand:+ start:324 stop:650 length:327 start_codon:yes stop_codon:yes gene_type:complete